LSLPLIVSLFFSGVLDLLVAGSGLGGVVFPLLINGLLSKVGFNWTLRFFALFFLVILGPATYLTHSRVAVRLPTRDPSEADLLSKEGVKGFLRSLIPLVPKARDYAFVTDSTWIIVVSTISNEEQGLEKEGIGDHG